MDEGKKKMIMVVVIVACIAVAVVITIATHSRNPGSIDSLDASETILLKCRDPNCGNNWQTNMKEYYEYVEKNREGMTVPGAICPQCGGETGYPAVKCPHCGLIFERGSGARGEFPDKCPKCGHSAIEDRMNARKKKH